MDQLADKFLLLILGDLFFFFLIRFVMGMDWKKNGAVPLWLASGLLSVAIFAHLMATLTLSQVQMSGEEAALALCIFVLSGLPPIVAGVRMVTNTIVHSSVDGLYGWNSSASVATYDLTRAYELMRNNNVEAALVELRRSYQKDFENPGALFAMAALLQSRGRVDEAVNVYREIIQNYYEGTTAWVSAAYQLAMLYHNVIGDDSIAKPLFREVIRHRPQSEMSYMAAEHLRALKTEPAPV